MSKCRICLKSVKSEKLLQIYGENGKIALKIYAISGVKVADSKGDPALICRQCEKDLQKADSFRIKCIQADENFRSKFSKELVEETFRDDFWIAAASNETNLEHFDTKSVPNLDITPENIEKNQLSDQNFSDKSSKSKKTKEKFFCSKCAKCFCDQNYLKKHEYFRHSEIPVEDLFECDFCGHKTKTKQLIRNHIITVHSTLPKEKFICRVCGKLLSTKGNLDSHEKTHLQIDPADFVSCPICQKAFREKRFMVEHRKLVHDKSKTIQCPHCDHVSTCKGAFNKHNKSVHLKLRDFKCNDCGSGFSTNSQLTRHYRIHTGERPYECKNCSKAFRLSSHRKRHEEICPKR